MSKASGALLWAALGLCACSRGSTDFVADDHGGGGTGEGTSTGAKPEPEPAEPQPAGGGDADTIKIGALFAFKSRSSVTEENTFRGIQVAVKAVNDRGGIGGRRIEMVKLEFDGTAQDAELAARRGVELGLVAVLGPSWSNPALAAAPVLDAAGVPMVVTLATNPDITRGRPWVFRIASDDRAQAQALAEFSCNQLGRKRYASFVDLADKASESMTALFAGEMRPLGGIEVEQIAYTADDQESKLAEDWRRLLARHDDLQVIFLPLKVRDVGRVMRAGRAAGYSGIFIGGDGWGANVELFAAAGRASTGSFFSSHWNDALDAGTSIEFLEAFVDLHKSVPTLGAAMGYDAARLLFDVIERAGTDRRAIRDLLAATADFPCSTGTLTMDGEGNAIRPLVILRVELARFVPERLVRPDLSRFVPARLVKPDLVPKPPPGLGGTP